MAGSDKSNLGTETKKKTAALDENFGNDFLSFWGSPKKGKDNVDFGMGEAPKNKRKPFDFDKLDDFELSGDFGKLSDFKMNMTGLDFSTLDMSHEKPTAKPAEKQESKKDDFSFNFDFDGLDKFEFGSGPAESKSKPNTIKHATQHDSKSNSSTSTDLLKDKEKSKSVDKTSAASKHENVLESELATSEDLEGNVMSRELLSEMKETSISDRNKDKTYSNEDGHKKQAQETCFARITTQDFILQSQLRGCSPEDDDQQLSVKVGPAMGKSCSMRTDSSHSKHNVPENSGNSECFPETRMNEHSTSTGELQNKFEGNQNVVACEMEVPSDSYQGQLRIHTNTEEKHGLGSNLILPPQKSYSSALKPMSLNAKLASALQKRSLKKSAENELYHASSATDSIPKIKQNAGKLVTLMERNLEFPIKALPKIASSSLMKKSGSMSAFLKKKTFEVPSSTLEKLKSVKHDIVSSNEGKSFDSQEKGEKALAVAVSEMSNTDHYNKTMKEVSAVEVHQEDGEIDKTKNKTSPIRQNTFEEVREDTDNDNTFKEEIDESCFVKPCSEKDTSPNTNMRRVGSSLSRSTSPENSYRSRPNDRENEILSKSNLTESDQNNLKNHIDSSEALSKSKQSPLHRNSNSKVTMRDKVMSTIHSTSSDKAVQNVLLKPLPVNDKEASSDKNIFKALNISPPLSDTRFSKQNHENIRAQNINILKSNDISSNKSLSVQKNDASRFEPKASNLSDHPNGSNTMTNISLSPKLNYESAKEANIATASGSNSKSPLNKTCDNSAAEKSVSYVVPMKRRMLEDSTNLNPSKRVKSPAGRVRINISPNAQHAVVPVAELGGITTRVERIAPLKKDEIGEKAEAYSKQLEAMCERLRKEIDEGEEVVSRASVNNNALSNLKRPYLLLHDNICHLLKNSAATVVVTQAMNF